MQRSISIHPASLLIGLALAVVVFLTMSQGAPLTPGSVRVVYGPDPRDMVQIDEGTPYTVPAGKLFVLTALGVKQFVGGGGLASLLVNGQVEVYGAAQTNGGVSSSSVVAIPTGFTAIAGAVLEPVSGVQSFGRAWGYLAPQ